MVTLTLKDGLIEVSPSVEGLKNELRYWRREVVWDNHRHSRAVQGSYEDLYSETSVVLEDGTLSKTMVTMPGFAHRILDFLRRSGIEYVLQDHRTPMPTINYKKAMDGLRDYQMELVYKMLESGGGILSGATGAGKTRMAAAIINAFDKEELKLRGTPLCVFACSDKDINRKNYEELARFLPDRDVGLVMSGSKHFSDDVQVITTDSLHLLDPSQVGILIMDEMHTSASDHRAEEVSQFMRARKWGVSATPTGRFDGKDLVSEGLYGPLVAQFTYQDGVKSGALVPITVYWVNCPEPQIGVDRYLMYQNREHKVRQGNTINEGLAQTVANIFKRLPDDMQALCMTQFIEQMWHIKRNCGDDVICAHAETSQEKLSRFNGMKAVSNKERKEIYDSIRNGDIKKAISTFIFRQGVDFPGLDLVISACGGGSDIAAKQIPGRASRKADGKDHAYVIDFWHPWDQTETDDGRKKSGPLLSSDKSRRKSYSDLGFQQIWTTSLTDIPFLLNSETQKDKQDPNKPPQ